MEEEGGKEYRWEAGYEKTWEAIQEDKEGLLDYSVQVRPLVSPAYLNCISMLNFLHLQNCGKINFASNNLKIVTYLF